MDAVRQIFRDDPNVVVTQGRSGMLRIMIGSVSPAILQARIRAITLNPIEQYNVLSAVDEIAGTAGNYAREHELHLRLAPFVIDHLVSGPVEGAPHLPAVLRNVTVDEALDAVVRKFYGIALYGTCVRPDGKELFMIGYTNG